ncbi:MAG: response regulator transcription factor [Sphingobacteriales bacterium]|nr:MAG: response regulator transcription factor [Sphingobacteriales bacterium]
MSDEKKTSILLVEDEENLHEALKLNLELEGYDVISAFDGAAALKAVETEYFDLIILDVMLPEMDGISVAESIRISNKSVEFAFSRICSYINIQSVAVFDINVFTKIINKITISIHRTIDSRCSYCYIVITIGSNSNRRIAMKVDTRSSNGQ